MPAATVFKPLSPLLGLRCKILVISCVGPAEGFVSFPGFVSSIFSLAVWRMALRRLAFVLGTIVGRNILWSQGV